MLMLRSSPEELDEVADDPSEELVPVGAEVVWDEAIPLEVELPA